MTTLHIEHPVTDLAVWRAAFDRFADRRRQGGVSAERVQRPVDDDHYVVIEPGLLHPRGRRDVSSTS